MLKRLIIGVTGVFAIRWVEPCRIGRARILDGDSIVVDGEMIRIHGIDAPEIGQPLWWRDQQLDGGAMATAALEALTAGVTLRCEGIERDRYDRLVAKCYSPKGIDIGRRMVLAGWALAYRSYSHDYVAAEAVARKARRGMWRGRFVAPWDWRRANARGEPRNTVRPTVGIVVDHPFQRRP